MTRVAHAMTRVPVATNRANSRKSLGGTAMIAARKQKRT